MKRLSQFTVAMTSGGFNGQGSSARRTAADIAGSGTEWCRSTWCVGLPNVEGPQVRHVLDQLWDLRREGNAGVY
jgi:hypothetical protein